MDICRQPTSNRGRYVVVRFNFSTFGTDPAKLEREFDEYCRRHVRDAVEDHPDLFPAAVVDRIQAASTANGQLDELFLHARREGIPLYVLIDEYDNFANTILAGEGAEAYYAFTHGGGFFRSFFATLKAGTENGSVERLFVTGVSYVKHSVPNKAGPRQLIDSNVRIDNGKLRHLLLTGRQLNGNFDLLRRVISEGGRTARSWRRSRWHSSRGRRISSR